MSSCNYEAKGAAVSANSIKKSQNGCKGNQLAIYKHGPKDLNFGQLDKQLWLELSKRDWDCLSRDTFQGHKLCRIIILNG